MNWLKLHKDQIIVGVLVLVIFQGGTAFFNWLPSLFSGGDSIFADWWITFELWGNETVTFEKSKFQILSAFCSLLVVFVQVVFWFINKNEENKTKYLSFISKIIEIENKNAPSSKDK